ncbi:Gfo/Idh/MocA family protein [Phytoactinopolyspora limicola]|uniref:Gfo/Idh/MocA family protein n=1 Tax=Phytoactinopolyspora limicola TaxID=2715536 RepID=UPI0014084016|nr:Gfo/Idh/MocA family oxidoreductase [Phytoactinopolyspora limicola]
MKHKVAIIGCGKMEATHQDGLANLADRLEIAATVDPVVERAEAAARLLGAERATADLDDVIDEIDAALVVTPHHVHHEIGMQLLKAGKHVLMEKPLAITEAECLELITTGQAAGRVLMTAYPMRFHPLVTQLKEHMDDHLVGEIFQVSIWTEQRTQREPGHWIGRADTLGGGQLFSHGCHYVDLLLWFLGTPVRGTHIGTRKGTPWLEREGTSNVSIEFANGALGYHFGTWGARGSKLSYSIHVHGTEGMLEADFRAGELRLHTRAGIKVLAETRKRDKYVEYEIAHFLDRIEDGRAPMTDGPGSLQGLRLIWRLYQAEDEGVVADLSGLGLDQDWTPAGLDRLPG